MSLDNLCESIYVINLKERVDRKKHIENELKKIDCKTYTLIEGIDGTKVHNTSRIKNGAYGLLLTYKKIYENWKKTKNMKIF